MKETSELYQTSKHIPFASRISLRARKKVYDFFLQKIKPSEETSILDIGVTIDENHPESNILEYSHPYKKQITCVGVEDASHLERRYPGIRFIKTLPHQPLPFADKKFDVAYSNAVLEHVGTREQQRFFIHEMCRVGKQVFISAPNRLFPIEHHTAFPLIHYLPNSCFRAVAKMIGLSFWSKEENLNLFYPWEILELFPKDMMTRLDYIGLGVGIFRSNICVVSK